MKTKYGELARYLASGLLSAAASFIAMHAANLALFAGTHYPDAGQAAVLGVANWTAGMAVAYILNRAWVFRTKSPVRKEFPKFLASRIGTFFVDQSLRQLSAMAGMDAYLASFLILGAITVLNYIIGKTAVFKR